MGTNMRSVLLIFVIISVMPSKVLGGCTAIPYPKEIKECYEEVNRYEMDITGTDAAQTCIGDYLWVTADRRWHPTYSNETLDYLGNLYGKYIEPPPVREKRQTRRIWIRRFRSRRTQFWRRFVMIRRQRPRFRPIPQRRPPVPRPPPRRPPVPRPPPRRPPVPRPPPRRPPAPRPPPRRPPVPRPPPPRPPVPRPPPPRPPVPQPPPPRPPVPRPPPPPPTSRRCVRKEIRQLTKQEYDTFVNCVNRMKRDTSIWPNVYESIARVHNGAADHAAHRGQAFNGWHTLYMLLFELNLRDCPGRPCLPYWDTSLDYPLPDPRESIFFNLIGGSEGLLKHPFPNWSYISDRGRRSFVNREISDQRFKGMLVSDSELRLLLSSTDTHQMARFSSNSRSVIEGYHNSIHGYASGTVGGLTTAPQDILFFLLHGFIEYIFSENLKNMPDNVRSVYPRRGERYPRGHRPEEVMGVLGRVRQRFGDREIRNWEAYQFGPGSWRSHFEYAPRASCRDNCQTPRDNLFCCRFLGHCVSKVKIPGDDRDEVGIIPSALWEYCSQPRRFKRDGDEDTEIEMPYEETKRYIVQNDYVMNGIPDCREWVYIGVLITNIRPQEEKFQSYSIENGEYERKHDIYDASNCTSYNDSLKVGKAKPFKGCRSSKSGSSAVYVRTDGINYSGYYKDYAIIDERLAVSESVAYVAIKKPRNHEDTEVILTAYDECGRLCRPMCEVQDSPGSYESCDGVLRVDNKPPLVYRDTVNDVMSLHWGFNNSSGYRPYSKRVPYCINFICDATTDFYRAPRK